MPQGTVRVRGLKEFQRALKQADPALRKQVRAVFKETGDIVRREGVSLFSDIDTGSAAGFRTRVRDRGVSVEQSKRRVTGKRGDYGRMQMTRALEPALAANETEVIKAFEEAIDKVADIVEG